VVTRRGHDTDISS